MPPAAIALRNTSGSALNTSGSKATPKPMPTEVAAITASRRLMPWVMMMRTPAIAIRPNISTIAPPSTGEGMVVNTRPTTGNSPASTKIAAI